MRAAEQALIDDNLTRNMLVTVDVLFRDEGGAGTAESGYPAEMELYDAPPAAPGDLAADMQSGGAGDEVLYNLNWTVSRHAAE